mgnify:CR=1 FL=1
MARISFSLTFADLYSTSLQTLFSGVLGACGDVWYPTLSGLSIALSLSSKNIEEQSEFPKIKIQVAISAEFIVIAAYVIQTPNA